MARRNSSFKTSENIRRGFDIGAWFAPTLGFFVFMIAFSGVVAYTYQVGGPNVSLYIAPEEIKRMEDTNVGRTLQGISDALNPEKKYEKYEKSN